jgi:O-antigen/teichoic acid export membrane protein
LISKQIIRNFLSLFLSSVVGQLFTLWAFIQIARIFGPEGFGRFSFAQVFALYFLFLADFGLQTFGARAIAQGKKPVSRLVWDITALRLIFASVCFILLLLVDLLLPEAEEVKLLILISGIALFPYALSLEWAFQGMEKMEYVGVGRVLKGLVFAGLVYFFVRTQGQLSYAVAFSVVGFLISSGVLLWLYMRKFGASFERIEWQEFPNIVKSAFPLATGSMVTQINYNFGTLALGFFLSDKDVGVFSAANKIVLFLAAFGVTAASNAILPQVVKAFQVSTTVFTNALGKLLRFFVLLALPLGVGGTILGPSIINFLYSGAYHDAIIVFQISVWLVTFALYRVVVENALIAARRERKYIIGYTMAGTVTVVGNLALIPMLGVLAPAIIALVSELAVLSYFVASCKFVRSVDILRMTVKPFIAAMIMGAFLTFFALNIFVLIPVGALLYFAMLLLLRCVTIQEIRGHVLQFAGE